MTASFNLAKPFCYSWWYQTRLLCSNLSCLSYSFKYPNDELTKYAGHTVYRGTNVQLSNHISQNPKCKAAKDRDSVADLCWGLSCDSDWTIVEIEWASHFRQAHFQLSLPVWTRWWATTVFLSLYNITQQWTFIHITIVANQFYSLFSFHCRI